MDCREFESKLPELILGDLGADDHAICWAHLDMCSSCAKIYVDYQLLAGVISNSPMAEPSQSESIALASALSDIRLGQAEKASLARQNPRGFGEFVAASLAVFMLVTTLLMLQIRGAIDIRVAFNGLGALNMLAAFVVLVFITSFVPILITARRQPLNGMTFRR
ncbi:MAG: zf-HC2 domain-containing protein [Armatimonadetes bacterium]|nr:zf-HC2 domain-containing protein [Armatimonadota bacterium]